MITNSNNPWLKRIREDDAHKQQVAVLTSLVKKARELLADEKFIEYRKLYENYHDTEIENLMMLSEQEPLKYAFKVRQIIDTLKAYRLLITSIEENAAIQLEEAK